MFRGREQSRPELGFRLLKRLADDVQELGVVEYEPRQEGRNMLMVLAPTKKKAEAMAEARQARDERRKDAGSAEPAEDDAPETEAVAES
jgi:translation initiation factor IF-3